MARALAETLGGEVDAVLVHKLGHPSQPEVAMGALDQDGRVTLNELGRAPHVTPAQVEAEVLRQQLVLESRAKRLRGVRPPCTLTDRVVIVVDDGVATGSTMEAAIRAVRRHAPKRLVAAMAVAPPSVVDRLRGVADEVVCLLTPAYFFAVGGFFEDFSEVSDEEAAHALQSPSVGATEPTKESGDHTR